MWLRRVMCVHNRDRGLYNPAAYPARYEADWLHRRRRRVWARALVGVVAFALFAWPVGWRGALVIGFLAGLAHFLYTWRRHHMATSWHKDAYAERKSVHVLVRLENEGYAVLHDHRIGDARIQSLLIGPTGVWLVHAVGRTLQRRMWGSAAYLHPEDQPVPPSADELNRRARRVGDALSERYGEPVAVRPVFVAVGGDVPDGLGAPAAPPVVDVTGLRTYVQSARVVLSAATARRIAAVAESVLPARDTERQGSGMPPMAVKKGLWSRRKGLGFVRETDIGGPQAGPDDDGE